MDRKEGEGTDNCRGSRGRCTCIRRGRSDDSGRKRPAAVTKHDTHRGQEGRVGCRALGLRHHLLAADTHNGGLQ
jgi:hypothetical protein